MGLNERNNSHSNFLGIKHGAICLESNEPKEGYELIEGEVNGVQYAKYYRKFASLDGQITKLEWYDREHNGSKYRGLKVTLRDEGEFFQLDLPFGKRHYDTFTKVMDNIAFEQPVEFVAFPDKKDHRVTVMLVKQNGKIVPWKYTRENMGDCPEAEQDAMGNWSFRNQQVWLWKRLTETIIPHVDALNAFDEPQPDVPDEVVPVADANDDIPF